MPRSPRNRDSISAPPITRRIAFGDSELSGRQRRAAQHKKTSACKRRMRGGDHGTAEFSRRTRELRKECVVSIKRVTQRVAPRCGEKAIGLLEVCQRESFFVPSDGEMNDDVPEPAMDEA